MKKTKWKIFVLCLVLSYLVGFLGSLFTSPNTSGDWYSSIKPEITPPSFVFPIVWNILFFLITLSLYFAWINSKKKDKLKLALVFGINFVLNIFWTFLFFSLKELKIAFIEIIVLEISIASMIWVCWKIDRRSSYLLLPYFLWVGFASVLNFLAFS